MAEGKDPRGRADDAAGSFEVQYARVVDGDEAKGRASPLSQLLPRYEVCVVLHLGDHNLVAGAQGELRRRRSRARQGGVQERVTEQVQALGGVGGPDDLIGRRAQEGSERFTGILEGVRGFDRQQVGTTVNGGVALLVKLLLGFDDAERVLRGRPGVQIDQGVPAHGPRKHGEVIADPQHLFVGQCRRQQGLGL